MLKRLLPLLILFVLIIPFVVPLFHPGYFVTDDGDWMVIRLSAFHQALRSGQFPVRFLPTLNHGYGYPVLDFLYPLPFYIGEIIHLLGFSFLNSIKLLFVLSFVLSAWTMYLFAEKKWGRASGIMAGLFYALAPYRLYDVYTRGSIGEAVAFIFPPLIFYFLEKFFRTNNFRDLSLAALSLAALITAHNVIAFLFFPVIVGYLFMKGKRSWRQNTIFIILSLAASAWFWFPALFDLQFTKAPAIQVSDFADFFLRSNDFLSLVGWLIPLIFILVLIKTVLKKDWSLSLWLLVTFLSFCLSTSLSSSFWSWLPLPHLVQFPWRFLSVTVFGSSLLLAYLVNKTRPLLLAGLFIAVPLASLAALPSLAYTNHPDSFYSTNDDTTTVQNEYQPKWVSQNLSSQPAQNLRFLDGGGKISHWQVSTVTQTTLEASQVYFPGQTVFADNEILTSYPSPNGLLKFFLPGGQHKISIAYRETPWQLLADACSLLALGVAALIIWKSPSLEDISQWRRFLRVNYLPVGFIMIFTFLLVLNFLGFSKEWHQGLVGDPQYYYSISSYFQKFHTLLGYPKELLYPPGANLFFFLVGYISRLFGSTFVSFQVALLFVNATLTLILFTFVAKTIRSLTNLFLFSLLLLAAGPIIFYRFDLLVILSLLISLFALKNGRYVLAGSFLAAASALKIFPVILLPFYLLVTYNRPDKLFGAGKLIISFILVLLMVIGFYMFLTNESLAAIYTGFNFNFAKSVQIESTWGSLLTLRVLAQGAKLSSVVFENGVFVLSRANMIGGGRAFHYLSMLGLVGVYVILFVFRRKALLEWSLTTPMLIILTLIVSSQVISPQYILWVILLIPFLSARQLRSSAVKLIALSGILILLATQYVYPTHYFQLIYDFYGPGRNAQIFWTLAFRNLLLVGLWFLLLLTPNSKEG